jgi:hypothetical protein
VGGSPLSPVAWRGYCSGLGVNGGRPKPRQGPANQSVSPLSHPNIEKVCERRRRQPDMSVTTHDPRLTTLTAHGFHRCRLPLPMEHADKSIDVMARNWHKRSRWALQQRPIDACTKFQVCLKANSRCAVAMSPLCAPGANRARASVRVKVLTVVLSVVSSGSSVEFGNTLPGTSSRPALLFPLTMHCQSQRAV